MNITTPTYEDFLRSKIAAAPETGFEIEPAELSPTLKPHERDAVIWALRGGRRALFESFGLGKTVQQLEILRLILKHHGGKALIVAPLGVRQEFKRDAERLLNGLPIQYVRTQAECEAAEVDILITNYERVRDGDIDPTWFTAVSLDEASVLRSFGSKTYQTFLEKFRGVQFKFVATATPSPNKYKELIHYAGYLEVMDTGQALTRFFHRDSTQANNLTLYPHKEQEFWYWLSTWSLWITKPSDLGYDDSGYDLPPLEIRYHELKVDHSTAGAEQDGQVKLFRDAAIGLKDAASEKRESIDDRVRCMREIVDADPDDHFVIWHDLEAERHAIKRELSGAQEIYGSDDLDHREELTIQFSDGEIQYVATKPEISGSGVNWQRFCHRAIFLGIGYKFQDFLQAIHRILRYLQPHPVVIDVIYMESERQILDELLRKWAQHNHLVEQMTDIIKRHGLGSTDVAGKLRRYLVSTLTEERGRNWIAVRGDCVLATRMQPSDSVGLIMTSIPFSNHYEYTPTYNDFGHNEDNAHFFEQMDYLTPELLRILMPGRVAAIHVKDRILFGNATGTGMPTVDPFSDMTVAHFMRHGFQYMGRITVVTDVVRENNQTYRLGWSEQCKDGTKMGVGCPEYVLLFRKLPSDTTRAYADIPVTKSKGEYTRAQWQIDAHAFWRSSGDRLLTSEELRQVPVSDLQKVYRDQTRRRIYEYDAHVELAKKLDDDGRLPASFMVVAPGSWSDGVWDDVNRMRTLNGEQARKEIEMHICPLQFDIVDRIINRYSNPGEVVADPFGGLMTTPYRAVLADRRGWAAELNEQSFWDGIAYLKLADEEKSVPSLFDSLDALEKAE